VRKKERRNQIRSYKQTGVGRKGREANFGRRLTRLPS